jgi:hypothetical protein
MLSVALLLDMMQIPNDKTESRWRTRDQRENVQFYSEIHFDTDVVWEQLENVSRELDQRLGLQSSGKPIQIMLFKNHASYANYLTPQIPQAGRRKAIYYRNGDVSQIYAYHSHSVLTDLRHEMTHAILHQHLPFVPLWLDEGLAEYFEEDEKARVSSQRIATVQWKARVGSPPSLVSLESVSSAEEMDSAAYRDSWAFASFLLNESPESLKVLKNYVTAIHRGEAPGAFSSYAAARIPDFRTRANSYFRKITFRVVSASSREP